MIRVAVAARPYPGESVNGDRCSIQCGAGAVRIAVIDGLGHGKDAAAAAQAADDALAAHPDLPVQDALMLCHRALTGTRGAAITIARIDPERGQLTYAGIGNVEGRLWQEDREQRLTIHRGIVGAVVPTVRPITLALGSDWYLLLHTDGISGRFTLTPGPFNGEESAQEVAERLLDEWSRPMDDATVAMIVPDAPSERPTNGSKAADRQR